MVYGTGYQVYGTGYPGDTLKKLFVETYGCQMASLLHAGGRFHAELERVYGGIKRRVQHLLLGVNL